MKITTKKTLVNGDQIIRIIDNNINILIELYRNEASDNIDIYSSITYKSLHIDNFKYFNLSYNKYIINYTYSNIKYENLLILTKYEFINNSNISLLTSFKNDNKLSVVTFFAKMKLNYININYVYNVIKNIFSFLLCNRYLKHYFVGNIKCSKLHINTIKKVICSEFHKTDIFI